jgi:hypothetical protein
MNSVTDGYPDYKVVGGFWLLSSFCNTNVAIHLKQETVRPNLFITILGRSTTSRKSTVVKKTKEVYERVTSEVLLNEDFSLEGYLESLSFNNKQCHARDEASGFLAKIHKTYNEGFTELECAIYDGQSYKKTLASKGSKEPKVFEVIDPYVTKFYATTSENFLRYMSIDDFLCGREFRTLYVFPEYKKERMALDVENADDKYKWQRVLSRATQIYNFIEKGISFEFDSEALEYYSEVTSEMEIEADASNNSIKCSVVGRSQIHILKLAMLIELGKDPISTKITKESIEIAYKAVNDYFIPTLLEVIDRLEEDVKTNMVEKVLSILRRLGGTAQHTKLLHDSKLKAKDFREVIGTLIESDTIDIVKETVLLTYKIL